MQKTLFIKLSIIAGLCAFFAISLSIFRSIILERQNYAVMVIDEIAQQHVSPQTLINPFIVLPSIIKPECRTERPATAAATSGESKTNLICPPARVALQPIFSEQTQAEQKLTVSQNDYQRGIYHATSYTADIRFNQRYSAKSLNDAFAEVKKSGLLSTHQARVIIPVSDLRGIATLPTVTIAGHSIETTYPSDVLIDGIDYIEAVLPTELLEAYQTSDTKPLNQTNNTDSASSATSNTPALKVDISLPLTGMSSLSTVPTGTNFKLSMQSDWMTPNFIGDALPNRKTINQEGFSAGWQNQYLTVSNNQKIAQCTTNLTSSCEELASREIALNKFSVDFAEPNDVYLQTERSLKYGLLLILVSFGTFFLFEIIKSSRIHPVQYLMVGSALAIFYVLLLPLAEQVAFWVAYSAAATACVGLIGWYAYYMLGTVKRALIFTAILAGLYAAFYGILTTEDLNLLFGAIFCFVLLASAMIMTRKIDWYKIA